MAKKLAIASGFEDELNNIISNNNIDIIYASAANHARYICKNKNPNISQCPKNAILYCTSNYVELYKNDLSPVKSLKFKKQQQQNDSGMEIPDNWQGKIIYTDDIQPANAFAYTTQSTGR